MPAITPPARWYARFVQANDRRDPAVLAQRLWFPGPGAPYTDAQRRAISELVVSYVERWTAEYARLGRYPNR